MSFSSEVKEELAKQYSKSRHCQLAGRSHFIGPEGAGGTGGNAGDGRVI